MRSIAVVTLFPGMFAPFSQCGVAGRAIERGLVGLKLINPRDYACDAHRTVDDRPYGGGPGMVMMYPPMKAAIDEARAVSSSPRVVGLSPQGRAVTQSVIHEFVNGPDLVLVCGRYEGIDERLAEEAFDEEVSIGDYVLSGGEIAAMALVDAMIRLVPGVLGDDLSAAQDSFADGLLDCPHYTRPDEVDGRRVPEVLLSGDHEAIRQWRLKQSLGRTWLRRPDLLAHRVLDAEKNRLLSEFIIEYERKST